MVMERLRAALRQPLDALINHYIWYVALCLVNS